MVKVLFNVMGNYLFQPFSAMNREMFVTFHYRLAGSPAVSGSSSFSDVTDSSSWYYSAVLWATQNQIVNGMGDGSFGVGRALSREEMVTLLYRYAAFAGLDQTVENASALAAFADAEDVQSWAKEAMLWAVDKGIITGLSTTSISPGSSSNRAQVATVMQRMETVKAAEPEENEDAPASSAPEETEAPAETQTSESPAPSDAPAETEDTEATDSPAADSQPEGEDILPIEAA